MIFQDWAIVTIKLRIFDVINLKSLPREKVISSFERLMPVTMVRKKGNKKITGINKDTKSRTVYFVKEQSLNNFLV